MSFRITHTCKYLCNRGLCFSLSLSFSHSFLRLLFPLLFSYLTFSFPSLLPTSSPLSLLLPPSALSPHTQPPLFLALFLLLLLSPDLSLFYSSLFSFLISSLSLPPSSLLLPFPIIYPFITCCPHLRHSPSYFFHIFASSSSRSVFSSFHSSPSPISPMLPPSTLFDARVSLCCTCS